MFARISATSTNKSEVCRSSSWFLVLNCAVIGTLIWLFSGIASAGQVQTLPSQQSLPLPQAAPAPLSNQIPQPEVTIPPTFPGAQGGSTKEIPLPQVFRGCWRGTVPNVDRVVQLDASAGRTIWLTKEYTLCYKQTGYSGKWQLTFGQSSVADRSEVSDQRQAIKVKSVSGSDRAELTAYLHFRAPVVTLFGFPSGVTNTLDELTHLHCTVTPGKDAMDVHATVFVETNGRPSVDIYWHSRFLREPIAGPS